MSNEGVHFNKKLDTELKQMTYYKFKEVYPDLDFKTQFGRKYE